MSTEDEVYLTTAVHLAVENASIGQLPFGAVVVAEDRVVATGVNKAIADQDSTAHAEVVAVRNACRELQTLDLGGATIYASCEPCAMCHAVCAMSGIDRIVYAASRDMVPDLGMPSPNADLMARMQDRLRALVPDRFQQLAIDGAGEPFARFADRR